MSVLLSVQTSTGEHCPLWFTHTDSRSIRRHLIEVQYHTQSNAVMQLLEHFNLNLAPYATIGEVPEPLEQYLVRTEDRSERRVQIWKDHCAEMEATLHPPQEFIDAYTPLVKMLDSNPDVFAELGITDTYFVEGYFRYDLADLLHMFEWAVEHNIPVVRLSEG